MTKLINKDVLKPFDIGLLLTDDGTVQVLVPTDILKDQLLGLAKQHGSILLVVNFFDDSLKLYGVLKDEVEKKITEST